MKQELRVDNLIIWSDEGEFIITEASGKELPEGHKKFKTLQHAMEYCAKRQRQQPAEVGSE